MVIICMYYNTFLHNNRVFKMKGFPSGASGKEAFLNDQCKEIEKNNRMGKTRDLFKKIRDTKGTFDLWFHCSPWGHKE